MILPKYQPNFESLGTDEAFYLAQAMHLPEQHALDGIAILQVANEAGMDQADVVMTLAHDPSLQGVRVVEKLIGKPITRPAPVARTSGAAGSRSAKPPKIHVSVTRDDSRVITFVAENPKKKGSSAHARFALYKVGMTVSEFVAAGGTLGDVKWDAERGFIKFTLEDAADAE